MKLKVVACGVFEPELTELAEQTPNEVHLHFLDAGLHSAPDSLRAQVQAEIDGAVGKGYDAIILGYGLCGRGTSGLLARDTPVVMPRVHDCMTLFMGSREEYRRQFARHPGTFYTTAGWYEKKALGDKLTEDGGGSREGVRNNPRFGEFAEKYGEQNAADIIHFYDSWKRNYTRSAFIDTGVGDRERYEQHAKEMAAHFGWEYERLEGSTALLSDLLAGNWDDERICVLKPGQRSALTGDERIFEAIDVGVGAGGSPSSPTSVEPSGSRWDRQPACPAPDRLAAGPTTAPDRIVGPTTAPDRIVGPTTAPDRIVGPTTAPDTIVGPTTAPDTIVGPTKAPDTIVGPTKAPDTIVGPTKAPDTIVGPTKAPDRIVRPTTAPDRIVGPTMPEVIGLGIDAGGTYTDCVVYDLKGGQVLAKSKALTTHHDLLLGIDEALDGLEVAEPDQVRLVALSTTLATNSIVEGRGGTPGALIMSAAIGADAVSRAIGSDTAIRWHPLRTISGEMGIDGYEIAPPDPEEIAGAVDELLAASVDAFCVSGYASVKNPDHELLVKRIIQERCDLPVVCGHELSSRLNYVSRANTAILNARLLPVIRELLDAVGSSLERRGIRATLTVVKGDGSLVNRETALARPVETILSGPAASVSGAKRLTGLQDAIIIDMGGTTTDTAIIEQGLVRIDPDGARVGGWRTSVEAADISTIGLGGDSYLSFTADRRLLIGPRRVVPLAYLCHQHPQARPMLEAIEPAASTDRSTPAALDFFVLARPGYREPVGERESQIMEALREGPMSREALAQRIGAASGRLVHPKRLEQLGVVQRSALTPTDVLHVTGEFRPWDVAAATHALEVFSGLFGADVDEMIQRVRHGVIERLAGQIIAKEFPGACGDDPDEWPALLRTVFRPQRADKLRASLRYDRPIIAIGAPVKPFFPAVAEHLGAEVVIPQHAEVASAIGAIASEVVVRERAVVRPGEIANYVVHARSGRTEYEDLHAAVESAKRTTASLAQERAHQSGTAASDVKHRVDERRAFSAEGEEVLIEVLIEATVSGRPELRAAT